MQSRSRIVYVEFERIDKLTLDVFFNNLNNGVGGFCVRYSNKSMLYLDIYATPDGPCLQYGEWVNGSACGRKQSVIDEHHYVDRQSQFFKKENMMDVYQTFIDRAKSNKPALAYPQ